jgi:hypothetical protein
MKNNRLTVKDKKLREILSNENRKSVRKDFFELLRRASRKSAGKL